MKIREKKCKECGEKFVPNRPMQPCCSNHDCMVSYAMKVANKAKVKREKVEKSWLRARKEAVKTRSDYMKEAQKAFNQWVRARDYGKPCICCGKIMDWTGNKVDAGHYRSTGSANHMRFVEDNCHAQDKKCNRWGAGRAVDYRIGLIARIGLERVAALEMNNTVQKWSIDDLKAIRDLYKAKYKELLKYLPQA